MRQAKPEWQQKIAKERIDLLFKLAKEEFDRKEQRSRRYIGLARKLGMRYNVRFSRKMKDSFCKKCDTLFVPGRTMQTRVDSAAKSVIIKCKNCNYSYRKRYK